MSFFKNIKALFSSPKQEDKKQQLTLGNAVSLIPGKIYKVVNPFTDYDKILHPVGETGVYLGTTFLPYEDGLTIFFNRNGVTISYRLQWRKEEQADIIDNFSSFVEIC